VVVRTTFVSSVTTISTHAKDGSFSFSICFFTIVSNAISGVNKPVLQTARHRILQQALNTRSARNQSISVSGQTPKPTVVEEYDEESKQNNRMAKHTANSYTLFLLCTLWTSFIIHIPECINPQQNWEFWTRCGWKLITMTFAKSKWTNMMTLWAECKETNTIQRGQTLAKWHTESVASISLQNGHTGLVVGIPVWTEHQVV